MNDVAQRDVLSPEELKDVLRVYHGAPNDGELLGPFERIMAHDAALRERVALLEQSEDMSGGCFAMIHQTLEAFGTTMDGTSPMFYNDAVVATVWRYVDMMAAGELVRDGNAYRRVDGKQMHEPRAIRETSVGETPSP